MDEINMTLDKVLQIVVALTTLAGVIYAIVRGHQTGTKVDELHQQAFPEAKSPELPKDSKPVDTPPDKK